MNKYPQRERVMRYARDTFGTEPEYLWARMPSGAVLRHPASKKWYAIIMAVSRNKLGIAGGEPVDVLNVKCGPIMAGSLLAQEGFLPAYHMNKSSWVSILLDETVPDGQIFPLVELSYDSVAPKRRKTL